MKKQKWIAQGIIVIFFISVNLALFGWQAIAGDKGGGGVKVSPPKTTSAPASKGTLSPPSKAAPKPQTKQSVHKITPRAKPAINKPAPKPQAKPSVHKLISKPQVKPAAHKPVSIPTATRPSVNRPTPVSIKPAAHASGKQTPLPSREPRKQIQHTSGKTSPSPTNRDTTVHGTRGGKQQSVIPDKIVPIAQQTGRSPHNSNLRRSFAKPTVIALPTGAVVISGKDDKGAITGDSVTSQESIKDAQHTGLNSDKGFRSIDQEGLIGDKRDPTGLAGEMETGALGGTDLLDDLPSFGEPSDPWDEDEDKGLQSMDEMIGDLQGDQASLFSDPLGEESGTSGAPDMTGPGPDDWGAPGDPGQDDEGDQGLGFDFGGDDFLSDEDLVGFVASSGSLDEGTSARAALNKSNFIQAGVTHPKTKEELTRLAGEIHVYADAINNGIAQVNWETLELEPTLVRLIPTDDDDKTNNPDPDYVPPQDRGDLPEENPLDKMRGEKNNEINWGPDGNPNDNPTGGSGDGTLPPGAGDGGELKMPSEEGGTRKPDPRYPDTRPPEFDPLWDPERENIGVGQGVGQPAAAASALSENQIDGGNQNNDTQLPENNSSEEGIPGEPPD